jgi:hypothetical protein
MYKTQPLNSRAVSLAQSRDVYPCPNSNPGLASLRSDISSNPGGRGLICSPGRCLYLRSITACWVLVQQWLSHCFGRTDNFWKWRPNPNVTSCCARHSTTISPKSGTRNQTRLKGMCTHIKVVIRSMFRNIPTLCTASSTDEYQAHCKPSKHTQEYMHESTERPSP